MDLLSLYLKEFNQEFLNSPEDRRRLKRNLLKAGLTLVLIMVVGLILSLWQM